MPGAIGYLEYAYALQRLDKISFGVVQNSAGNFVVPDAASFQAAASSADWTADRDFHLVLTNAPGEDAYPITATTFVVMPKQPKSPETVGGSHRLRALVVGEREDAGRNAQLCSAAAGAGPAGRDVLAAEL